MRRQMVFSRNNRSRGAGRASHRARPQQVSSATAADAQTGLWISVCATAAIGIAVALEWSARVPQLDVRSLGLLLSVVAAAVALLIIPFTSMPANYYAASAVAILCYLTTLFTTHQLSSQIVLLLVFLTTLILLEPYPLNLIESVALVGAASALRWLAAAGPGGDAAFAEHQLSFAVPGLMVAVFGSLMTRYREMVVDLETTREGLAQVVVDLTRANTAYQDYAVDARERATESERQRITRDIHDIVGYTLTNNMMLMEAALDLMKENALALPALIETARSSAQEGLQQVREALYRLRQQESSHPVGLHAIARLLRIFAQATGIRIHRDFSNMPLEVSNKIDSAIYHLVQEALVNAFRHGRATEVDVRCHCQPAVVRVLISDNGIGATKIEEGIGLRGMRERIESMGGTVLVGTLGHGFVVDATIPRERVGNAGQTENPDR